MAVPGDSFTVFSQVLERCCLGGSCFSIFSHLRCYFVHKCSYFFRSQHVTFFYDYFIFFMWCENCSWCQSPLSVVLHYNTKLVQRETQNDTVGDWYCTDIIQHSYYVCTGLKLGSGVPECFKHCASLIWARKWRERFLPHTRTYNFSIVAACCSQACFTVIFWKELCCLY